MSCKKIAKIINTAILKKNRRYKGKQLKISFLTISNYLYEIYGKTKKIINIYSESQKKKNRRIL